MKVEDDILIIEDEITDEQIDEFVLSLSQEGIKKIEVKTPNLGASIIQALLVKKKDTQIVVEDEILSKVFENVSYKSI